MNSRILMIVTLFLTLGVWTAADAASRLTTDKKAYKRGEPITFTLHNDSNDEMAWGAINDYPAVYRIVAGAPVVVREHPWIVLEALGIIPPGETHEWVWDQKEYHQVWDNGDQMPPKEPPQVPAGTYYADFETMSHGLFTTPKFTIGSTPLAAQPKGKLTLIWARLKAETRR